MSIIKTKRNSIKKKVQNLSHESDDAVNEPLLRNESDNNSQSAKFIPAPKTESANDIIRDKNYIFNDAKMKLTGIQNNTNDFPPHKLDCTETAPFHNHMNANVFNSFDPTRNASLPKTQILVEIEGCKSIPYNPSSLIFTTARIHNDNKSKNLEPVQMTAVPILSTIEVSMSNNKKSNDTLKTMTSTANTNVKEEQQKAEPDAVCQGIMTKSSDTKIHHSIKGNTAANGKNILKYAKNSTNNVSVNPEAKLSLESKIVPQTEDKSQQNKTTLLGGSGKKDGKGSKENESSNNCENMKKKNVSESKADDIKNSKNNNTLNSGENKTDISTKQNLQSVKCGISSYSNKSSKDTVSAIKQLPRQKTAIVEDIDDLPCKTKSVKTETTTISASKETTKVPVDVIKSSKGSTQHNVSIINDQNIIKTSVINSPITTIITSTTSPKSSSVIITKPVAVTAPISTILTPIASTSRPKIPLDSKPSSTQNTTVVTKTTSSGLCIKSETSVSSPAAINNKPIVTNTVKSDSGLNNSTALKNVVKSPLAKTASVKTPTTNVNKVPSAIKSTVSVSTPKSQAPTSTVNMALTSANNISKSETSKNNGSKPNEFKKDDRSFNV